MKDQRTEPMISTQIKYHYVKKFPEFQHCEPIKLEHKQWVQITATWPFIRKKNSIIVTSDSGAGFKFAPYVADLICSSLNIGTLKEIQE